MEINVYDMLVFEDNSGNIYQDCVCEICKDTVLEKYIKCNNTIIYFDDNANITRVSVGSNTDYHLKEIWTRTDEDTYKKVWENK